MYENKDGWRVEMTSNDVMDCYPTINELQDGHIWCASCFGPVVDHEIYLFTNLKDAFEWVKKSIGATIVDEMEWWCWKDVYDTGTEWDIRDLTLPNMKGE